MRRFSIVLLAVGSFIMGGCEFEPPSCAAVKAARESLALIRAAVSKVDEAGMASHSRVDTCDTLFSDLPLVVLRNLPDVSLEWVNSNISECNEGILYAGGDEHPFSERSCYRRPYWLTWTILDELQWDLAGELSNGDFDALEQVFLEAEEHVARICSPAAPGTLHAIETNGGTEKREIDDYEYAVYKYDHSLYWIDGQDPEWEGQLWFKERCLGQACGGYQVSIGRRPDPAAVIADAKAFFAGSGGPLSALESRAGAICPSSSP